MRTTPGDQFANNRLTGRGGMTNRHLRMFLGVAASAVALLALPEPASSSDLSNLASVETPVETATGPSGDAYFYVGGLNVTDGFSDRWFLGLAANAFYSSGLGLHIDTSYIDREESAGFFAAGISAELTPRIRAKIMGGTSTDNDGILPELYARGELAITSAPDLGLVLRPSLTYRSFRNGFDEGTGQIEIARYFKPFANGSFAVGQVGASGTYSDPGSNFGYELSAGVTYVAPNIGTIGATAVVGNMAYDSVLGPSSLSVENGFIGIRPAVSYYLGENAELIARGEIMFTDFYDLFGGSIGIKFNF